MVTTVQHTFREEADHALHKAKQVNHAVLLSYSRRIASLNSASVPRPTIVNSLPGSDQKNRLPLYFFAPSLKNGDNGAAYVPRGSRSCIT
jgi:hypothetical protein